MSLIRCCGTCRWFVPFEEEAVRECEGLWAGECFYPITRLPGWARTVAYPKVTIDGHRDCGVWELEDDVKGLMEGKGGE